MPKKLLNKKKSIAERVAASLIHPNESDSDEVLSSSYEDEAPVVEKFNENDYDDLPSYQGTTEFRKKSVKLLSEQSERYKGKITSRKELNQFYEDSGSSAESLCEDNNVSTKIALNRQKHKDESEESDDNFSKNKSIQSGTDEVAMESDSHDVNAYEDDDDEDVDNDDEYDDDNDEEDFDEDIDNDEQQNLVNRVDQETEIQKGLCVKNQLIIWERLLELRIHSQKLLSKMNQLPYPLKEKSESEDSNSLSKETPLHVMKLLEKLLQLQDALIEQNSEVKRSLGKLNRKRFYPFDESNEGTNTNTIPIKELNDSIQNHFDAFHSYRNSVLLKWDDRTKLLVPGVITKKPKSNQDNYDILKKIHNTLMNKQSLIRKSQRMGNQGLEKNQSQKEEDMANSFNPEVYDDSDFYHEQLRELIEYKANTNTASLNEVTKQFIELQKIRQKMKKTVDTRASKGRKLRYVVHNKLVNFMAPNDTTTWTNDSKNELFRSLFV